MVKSMTGYGKGEAVLHGRTITVEIRSVNNRYLDCTIKLPRIYVFAEDAIKARVQKSISRGKVDVFVTIGQSENGATLRNERSLDAARSLERPHAEPARRTERPPAHRGRTPLRVPRTPCKRACRLGISERYGESHVPECTDAPAVRERYLCGFRRVAENADLGRRSAVTRQCRCIFGGSIPHADA